MWLCKNCGAEVNDNFDICQNCGTDWLGKPPDEKTKDSYPNKKYKIPASKNDGNEKEFGNNKSEFGKYPALKTIAGFIAILGILVIIVGIAGLIIFIKAANPFLGFGVLISCYLRNSCNYCWHSWLNNFYKSCESVSWFWSSNFLLGSSITLNGILRPCSNIY